MNAQGIGDRHGLAFQVLDFFNRLRRHQGKHLSIRRRENDPNRKALDRAAHDRGEMSGVLDLAGAQGRDGYRRAHVNHFSADALLLEEFLLLGHGEGKEAEVSSRQADSNSSRLERLSLGLREIR